MSPAQAIVVWLSHCRRTKATTTCGLYGYIAWRYREYVPERICDTTPEHIERYLHSLKGLKARSINSHIIAIKSFHRFLHDYYNLPNPAAKIRKLRALPPKQNVISQDDYQKLLDACRPIERAVLELLAHTGLRAAEARNLTQENLSADGSWIQVLGKGGRYRRIPINATLRRIISQYPNFDLLKSVRKKPALWRLCQRVSREANLNVVYGPHSFRRFFATQLLRKGVSVAKISKLLGHSSIRTTEIYLHLTDDDLVGVTNVLD
jgi:integrase/recombinase XerD